MKRIKDIVIDTFLSAKAKLNQKKRKNVFELFGFDFLIDEDFRTCLLEVNTNPFLGLSCEYLTELIPKMMKDLLKIFVFPYTSEPESLERINSVLAETQWEILYAERAPIYKED